MLLPQLPQFWLDRDHCDTFIDIVVPCTQHSGNVAPKPNITGYCTCDKSCSGLCGSGSSVTVLHDADRQHEHVVAVLPCHRVLLSAASKYFAALLSPKWNEGCSASIKHIPVVLSDAEDVPAMIALLKCIYTSNVNLLPSDLAAVAVFTSRRSTGDSHGKDNNTPTLDSGTEFNTHPGAATLPANCSCESLLQHLHASFSEICWQELSVRVLRLADQFSVPGALKAAVGKLSCLFSYQLSWPAVLAVLWLPAAVAQQPMMKELRQMAINRVTQDMKHLDPCLATSFGRSILQHLPPDALATLLGSDQLALYSENSTLAAIDVWLAGPVAASLGAAATGTADNSNCDTITAASTETADGSSNNSSSSVVGGQRLAAALQLLVRQVRLPLCSGAFLAAAVAQRSWLCLGMQGSHELNLMQQYYSSDSHGRYELAMRLLRSGQTCPWSVLLRRGMPYTFTPSRSSIHTQAHSSSSKGSSAATAAAFGTYTGLSQIRALLDSSAQHGSCLWSRSSSSTSLQSVQQQQIAAAGGVLLDTRVLGGYVWELSLVAVPAQHSSSSSTAAAACEVCAGSVVPAAAAAREAGSEATSNSKMLCLSIACQPAWATVLDENNPDYDPAAVSHDTAAAASGLRFSASCGNIAAAAGQMQQQQAHFPGGRCSTCEALWTIAGAKAAEAVARHTPVTQQLLHRDACQCTCSSSLGSSGSDASSIADPMQLCTDEAADANAPVAAGNGIWCAGGLNDSCSQVQTPGFCGQQGSCNSSGSSATSPVHLDVVVGIQLLASPSNEQLQQQAGDGTGKNSQQSPALSHLPCLLTWNAKSGAAHGLVPIHVRAIGSGSNVLSSKSAHMADQLAGAGDAVVGLGAVPFGQDLAVGQAQVQAPVGAAGLSDCRSGVLTGWQPELWSGLAPNGALYWHCSLRPLMD